MLVCRRDAFDILSEDATPPFKTEISDAARYYDMLRFVVFDIGYAMSCAMPRSLAKEIRPLRPLRPPCRHIMPTMTFTPSARLRLPAMPPHFHFSPPAPDDLRHMPARRADYAHHDYKPDMPPCHIHMPAARVHHYSSPRQRMPPCYALIKMPP